MYWNWNSYLTFKSQTHWYACQLSGGVILKLFLWSVINGSKHYIIFPWLQEHVRSIATSGSLWLVMWIPVCTNIPKILGEQNVRCEEYFGSGPGCERVRAYRNTAEVSAHQLLQDTGQWRWPRVLTGKSFCYLGRWWVCSGFQIEDCTQ